ncbi:MAG: hypothetical protein U9P90_00260, partial [Patescibacteria group bacterium]|nr:hypothetical protein [Patescibacteria group bacterium]
MKNRRKDWIGFLIMIVVVFTLCFSGIFSCSSGCDNEEGVIETEREIIYTNQEWGQITVYYKLGRRMVSYRRYLSVSSVPRIYSARLFVDGKRDGDRRIKSLEVWLNLDGRVSHVRVAGKRYGCLEKNYLTKEIEPVERNSKLCRDSEKTLNEWIEKLDPETRIKRAL